nr:MAG TPA: hypothetical protein [Caudoviricetes sp.]
MEEKERRIAWVLYRFITTVTIVSVTDSRQ